MTVLVRGGSSGSSQTRCSNEEYVSSVQYDKMLWRGKNKSKEFKRLSVEIELKREFGNYEL